jgi:hypothetical protein
LAVDLVRHDLDAVPDRAVRHVERLRVEVTGDLDPVADFEAPGCLGEFVERADVERVPPAAQW